MRAAVARVYKDPKNTRLRAALCIASRFLWLEAMNLYVECAQSLFGLVDEVERVFTDAIAALEKGSASDLYYRNVRQRYDGSRQRCLKRILARVRILEKRKAG